MKKPSAEEPEARPEESPAASLFLEPGALTSVIFQAPDLSTVVRPAPVAAAAAEPEDEEGDEDEDAGSRRRRRSRGRRGRSRTSAESDETESEKAPRKRATKAPREPSKTA